MHEILLLLNDNEENRKQSRRRKQFLRLIVNTSSSDGDLDDANTNDVNIDNISKTERNIGALMTSGKSIISPPADENYAYENYDTFSQEIQEQSLDVLFPKGYTSKTVTNLYELRNALNTMLPIEQPQQDIKSNYIKNIPFNQQQNNNQIFISERSYTTGNNFATKDEIKRFELFRSVIEHEDELLNHRVSWIILAQSFLMAAYITTSNFLNNLRFVTAAVGLLTVVVTLPAILAAGTNIEVQQQVYFTQITSDERCNILHGHNRDLSNKPNKKEINDRIKDGHVLPNMAFRGKTSIQILTTALMLAAVQVAGWIFLVVAVFIEEKEQEDY